MAEVSDDQYPMATTPGTGGQSLAEQQRDHAAAQAADANQYPMAQTAATKPSITGSSWLKLGSDLWDSTIGSVTAPHMPGSSGPQNAFAGQDQPNAPMYAPTMAGIARGGKDVTDTAQRGLTYATGGDMDAVRASQKASEDEFKAKYGDSTSASVGRVGGQILATSPFLGLGGRAIAAGGEALSSAIPALSGAIRFLQGGAGAATPGIEGVATRAASRVVPGAATGAGQAALTGDDVGTGAGTGAVVGPVLGAVLDPLGRLARRLTGSFIAPDAQGAIPDVVQERARQGAILQREGVPITAGQISNDPALSAANAVTSRVPTSGAIGNVEEQADAVRRAALARLGYDPAQAGQTIPSVASRPVLDAAETRIGNQFDTLAQRINGQAPASLGARLTQIEQDLPSLLGANELPIIQRQIDNLRQTLQNNNGQLTGQIYQDLVGSQSTLGKLMRGSASPDVKQMAAALRSAVDDAAMTLAPAGDQLAWNTTRSNWRALKTIDDAVTSSKSTLGDFSPADLLAATTRANKRFGGTGSLDELAQASHSLVQPQIDAQGLNKKIAAGGAGVAGTGATVAAVTNPALLLNPYTMGAGLGLLGLSPIQQGFNRAGAQNAINTATQGNAPRDIATALRLLTQGATASQQAP